MMKVFLLLADFLVAGVVAFVLNLLALIPFRRSKGKHWTERARVLYPAQVGAASQVWQIPVIVVLGQWVLFDDNAPYWILAGFAAWTGVVLASNYYSREVCPEITARAWLHQVLAGWSAAFLWWGIVVGIAVLMPAELDWRSWGLVGVFFAVYTVWAFGGFIWFGKKARVLNPAPERLQKIVEEVSSRMKVPIRGVWLVQSVSSTAYALPYTRDVFFSPSLLEKFPDDEIATI